MTLDELVLHDFGAYGGRQSVELTPIADRPIVLFGGMNGGGKTTLLDAIQLCLYGTFAKTSNRAGLSYPNYLDRSIHRSAGTNDAAVELAFSQNVAGSLHSFRLHRSWSRTPSGTRERLELLRNGEPDDLATEHWSEQVEQFMPARIAQLFLFDGEKIEGYADFEGTSTLIATAIQNLLGLDIVEQLVADLKTMERRKRSIDAPLPEDEELSQLAVRLGESLQEKETAARDRAAKANDIDRLRRELAGLDAEFRRRGGVLFERRNAITEGLAQATREVADLRGQLRELAAGAAPMGMLKELIAFTMERDADEGSRQKRTIVRELIEAEHAVFSALVEQVAPSARSRIEEALILRRSEVVGPAEKSHPELRLSETARSQMTHLMESGLQEEQFRANAMRERLNVALQRLRFAENELAGVPSDEAIAELLERRAVAQADLNEAEGVDRRMAEGLAALEARIDALRRREEALVEQTMRRDFERQDTKRILDHSQRARETLAKFRHAIVLKHIANIESRILASFRQLVGKGDLVQGVRIDPLTFGLELSGSDGRTLTPERLSAGERQILAVSILWGLAKASGRPLPTVIDTPLGRLDSVHRRHLVERYFPVASHQVLLLSTDQEIVDGNLAGLSQYVGRSYRLAHHAGSGRTSIEHGYFEHAS